MCEEHKPFRFQQQNTLLPKKQKVCAYSAQLYREGEPLEAIPNLFYICSQIRAIIGREALRPSGSELL